MIFEITVSETASTHSNSDCVILGIIGWAFYGLVRWALGLISVAGCIICQWGCTKYITNPYKQHTSLPKGYG